MRLVRSDEAMADCAITTAISCLGCGVGAGGVLGGAAT
jgi:hypothetical protein